MALRKTGQTKQTVPNRGPVPAGQSAAQVFRSTYRRGDGRTVRHVGACWAQGDVGVRGRPWEQNATRRKRARTSGKRCDAVGVTDVALAASACALGAVEFSEYSGRFSARPCAMVGVGWRSAERGAREALRIASSRCLDDGDDTTADRGGKSGPGVDYAGQLRVGRRGFWRKCCALCCALLRSGVFLGVFGVLV